LRLSSRNWSIETNQSFRKTTLDQTIGIGPGNSLSRIHQTLHQLTHFFQALDHFLQGKIFNSQQVIENVFFDFIAIHFSGFFAAGINKLLLDDKTASVI